MNDSVGRFPSSGFPCKRGIQTQRFGHRLSDPKVVGAWKTDGKGGKTWKTYTCGVEKWKGEKWMQNDVRMLVFNNKTVSTVHIQLQVDLVAWWTWKPRPRNERATISLWVPSTNIVRLSNACDDAAFLHLWCFIGPSIPGNFKEIKLPMVPINPYVLFTLSFLTWEFPQGFWLLHSTLNLVYTVHFSIRTNESRSNTL